MGWLALMIAVGAGVCAALPAPGMFLAMGASVLAMGLGVIGYRRRSAPGPARLAGAGAVTLGVIALVLSMVRYALTLAAIRHLETLL